MEGVHDFRRGSCNHRRYNRWRRVEKSVASPVAKFISLERTILSAWDPDRVERKRARNILPSPDCGASACPRYGNVALDHRKVLHSRDFSNPFSLPLIQLSDVFLTAYILYISTFHEG